MKVIPPQELMLGHTEKNINILMKEVTSTTVLKRENINLMKKFHESLRIKPPMFNGEVEKGE